MPTDDTANNRTWCSDAAATYGDRITWAREAAGLSSRDLAQRLGVRLTTVQAWENDRAEPRANRLQMMAGLLGVSLRWLLTGMGDGLDAPPGETVTHPDQRALLGDLARLRNQTISMNRQIDQIEHRLRQMIDQDAA
jgi:HTH-type transcriptional regulator, cell division transcriptional repressor